MNKIGFRISAVFFLWAIIYIPSLGIPQIDFDEHKRILPAISMMETGNWAVPELAGQKYFNKPPLINWMIAGSFIVTGGKSEFAARLPSVLAILIFSVSILFIRSSFLSENGKFFSALIFLSNFSLILKGRMAEIDAVYTCLTGLAIYLWASFRHDDRKWLAYTLPFIVLGFGLLLKGPMILLFFYILVITVLASIKSRKDLYSFPHFTGLFIMLGIFLAWVLYSKYYYGDATGDQGGKTPEMASTWLHELLLRFHDNINPGKWAGRVFSAIASFAPWVIFIPFLWKKDWISNIDEKDRAFFVACRNGAVIGFCLVCLMPGTRPRYSMPAIAFISIILGWLIACQKDRFQVEKIWKLVLKCLFPVAAFVFTFGALVAVSAYFISFPAKIQEFADVFKSPIAVVKVLVSMIFANFAVYVFFKNIKDMRGFLPLGIFSSILVAVVILFYTAVIIPPIGFHSEYREIGAELNGKVPEGEEICALQVGSEHFLFYLDRPVRHFYKLHLMPDDAKYFLIEKNQYDENKNLPFFTERMPDLLGLLKSDKRSFVLLKLNKNYVKKLNK